jgi:hypothetical protein
MPEATSLDNLPRINQRRKVEADDVYLWFDSIVVLNHGANHSIFNFPVVQVDADCAFRTMPISVPVACRVIAKPVY